MKGLLFCVGLIMNCLFSTVSFAQTQNVSQQDALANTQKQLQINRYKYSIKAPKAIDGNSDFNSMDITSHGGDLAKLLGDNIYKVDSLVVRGTVDDVDFHTLWDASFNGKLSVINMENAEVKNGIIPEDAFWHSEQLNIEDGYITLIHLRRIILPNGIKRIEDSAFAYVVNLEDVNIPSELQYIGPSAFEQCENLKTDPLVFPEGFEKLDGAVFANCTNLTGKVVLPSTIKEIGEAAFWRAKISSINFPEGLEKIGDAAFYGCRLEEVHIPNSCQDLGIFAFQLNKELKEMHLPDGIERIPNNFADCCINLSHVNIPSSVKSIGKEAFQSCWCLNDVELPLGLESIDKDAFHSCYAFGQLVFPATLNFLGEECCTYLTGVKRIYSMASEPPACEVSTLNIGYTPFGGYDSPSTPNDIPVYVPVGAAEKYRKAWGWDYFTNFIETDDFPTAIYNININKPNEQNNVYDLNGSKVANPQKGQIYIINGKKRIFIN